MGSGDCTTRSDDGIELVLSGAADTTAAESPQSNVETCVQQESDVPSDSARPDCFVQNRVQC